MPIIPTPPKCVFAESKENPFGHLMGLVVQPALVSEQRQMRDHRSLYRYIAPARGRTPLTLPRQRGLGFNPFMLRPWSQRGGRVFKLPVQTQHIGTNRGLPLLPIRLDQPVPIRFRGQLSGRPVVAELSVIPKVMARPGHHETKSPSGNDLPHPIACCVSKGLVTS